MRAILGSTMFKSLLYITKYLPRVLIHIRRKLLPNCMTIYLFIYLSMYISCIASIFVDVHKSIYLYVYLFHQCIYLQYTSCSSILSFVYLSIMFIYRLLHLFCLSVSVCWSAYPSVCLSVRLFGTICLNIYILLQLHI